MTDAAANDFRIRMSRSNFGLRKSNLGSGSGTRSVYMFIYLVRYYVSRFLMDGSEKVSESLGHGLFWKRLDGAKTESSIHPCPGVSGRYTYIHDVEDGLSQAVDQHHILVQRSKARKFLLCFVSGLFLAYICHLSVAKEPLGTGPLLIITLAVILVRSSYRSSVEKESVIIMPSLGVQLVTHYISGSTERRFVPISKVLKPLLNECVTPVTCYWSLALLVGGEPEIMLVFQKLQPPVKMLIPVWKALCSATMGEQNVGN